MTQLRKKAFVGGQGDNGLFNESPAEIALRDAIVMQRNLQSSMEANQVHSPASAPVTTQVTAPVFAQVSAQVSASPMSAPISTSMSTSMSTPVFAPMSSAQVSSPVTAQVSTPVSAPAFGGGAMSTFKPSSSKKGTIVLYDDASQTDIAKLNIIKKTTPLWEKAGFTILWITHYKLQGIKTASGAWMKPITHLQFNNMLLKKTAMYDELLKKNGSNPFNKTLVIIEDVSKLLKSKAHCIFAKLLAESTGRLLMFAPMNMPLDHDSMKMLDLLHPNQDGGACVDELLRGNVTKGGRHLVKKLASHLSKA